MLPSEMLENFFSKSVAERCLIVALLPLQLLLFFAVFTGMLVTRFLRWFWNKILCPLVNYIKRKSTKILR